MITCPHCERAFELPPKGVLSKRERNLADVFCRMGAPKNKQLADEIGVTEQVVKNYLGRIYKKLGITRTELMKYWNCELFQAGVEALAQPIPDSAI